MPYRGIAVGCLLAACLFAFNAIALLTRMANLPSAYGLVAPSQTVSRLLPAPPEGTSGACEQAVIGILRHMDQYQEACVAAVALHYSELEAMVRTQAGVSAVAAVVLALAAVVAYRRGSRQAT